MRVAKRFQAKCNPVRVKKTHQNNWILFRLVRQIGQWAAEIGRGRILADLDNAAADGAGAGEVVEQRFTVTATDRAGEFREVLVEGAEHFQHGLLVGEEHVAPHGRIGGGDAGEIAEAAGGEFDHLRRRHLFEFVGGADDGVGDQMRQMAGNREHEVMMVGCHDLVLAITSHLPHLIAYTIVGTADELEGVTQSEVLKFSAGGFRDFTRIAASDPIMWRDVFLANKEAVLEMLGTFNEDLSKLTRAIRRGDGEALFEHFTRTRAIRRGIVEIGQDSAAPDFGRPHAHLGKKAE